MKMAILSDFDIFAQTLNSSCILQSEYYATKSSGNCLYIYTKEYTTFKTISSQKMLSRNISTHIWLQGLGGLSGSNSRGRIDGWTKGGNSKDG